MTARRREVWALVLVAAVVLVVLSLGEHEPPPQDNRLRPDAEFSKP